MIVLIIFDEDFLLNHDGTLGDGSLALDGIRVHIGHGIVELLEPPPVAKGTERMVPKAVNEIDFLLVFACPLEGIELLFKSVDAFVSLTGIAPNGKRNYVLGGCVHIG
jgi:hypothetical protein